MAGMEARPPPPPTYERLRGFNAERMGMSPDATDQSAAQRADQGGNDLEPNPRPDGFHRADGRRLHEGPGFLQGVTRASGGAAAAGCDACWPPRPFSGSEDIRNVQVLCCRCKAGKRDAIGQSEWAALIAVGCRPVTGCGGRATSPRHWR